MKKRWMKISKAERDFICYKDFISPCDKGDKHIIKEGEDIYWTYLEDAFSRQNKARGFCKECYDKIENGEDI